jgi:hypothetical protein
VFAWIWPNSDRQLVNHCALPPVGQTWVLAPIDAVFEMGVLNRTYGVSKEQYSNAAPFRTEYLSFPLYSQLNQYN